MIVGIGIDLVEVARVAAVAARKGDRFLRRILTDLEWSALPARPPARWEYVAGRFAVKEAVMKALGTGWARGVGWRQIEVRRQPGGPPRVVLYGRAAAIARELGATRWHVSITDAAGLAVAQVVAESGPQDEEG